MATMASTTSYQAATLPTPNSARTSRAKSATLMAAHPRADAVPLGVARVRCAYPVTLTVRADPTVQEASWVGGPPSRPVVRRGDRTYSSFDAVVKAMCMTSMPSDATARHIARTAIDARVALSRPGRDDDAPDATVYATVPLVQLLDAVTRYGRTATHICVSRNAQWVALCLAQSLPAPAVRPRRITQRDMSDMERMMRRLDRIVSEVASDMRLDVVDDASSDTDPGAHDNDIAISARDGPLATPRPRPLAAQSSLSNTAAALTGEASNSHAVVAADGPAHFGLASMPPRSSLALDSQTDALASSSPQALSAPLPNKLRPSSPTITTTATTTATRSQVTARRAVRQSTRKRQATEAATPDTKRTKTPKRARHAKGDSASDPSSEPISSSSSTTSATASDSAWDIVTIPCALVLRPCAQAPGIECSICMRDDGTVLWDAQFDQPATLHDLWIDPGRSTLVADGARLADDTLVVNPCRNTSHAVCVGCMRAVLLNPGRPPVGVDRAVVSCISLDGESRCASTSYAEARVFCAVLHAAEVDHLIALYNRHRFPGMEIVACPLHIAVDRPAQSTRRRGPRVDILPCGAECMVEHAAASRATRGHLVITCTQNAQCTGSFCYHCQSRLPAGASRCGRCARVSERDNPDGVNRYFCRPALVASATKDDVADDRQPAWLASGGGADAHLMRNREITKEMAVDQIERVLTADRVAQPCYRCGVPLLKSTECNGLSHCGVQKCYMCGRNALAGGHLEPDHWDANGATGCPRYDHHAYWRRMKSAPFVCAEGRCYNDTSECKVAAHRAGIEAMHAERRVWHVWGMLRSLSQDLCARVLECLVASTESKDDERALLLARVAKTLAKEGILTRSTIERMRL